jgi:hypothetical protein
MTPERITELLEQHHEGGDDALELLLGCLGNGIDPLRHDGKGRNMVIADLVRYQADHDGLLAEVQRLTDELDRLRDELGDKIEWTIGHIDTDGTYYAGQYTEAGARHHAAMRRQGEHFPAYRRVGNWQRAAVDGTR